MSKKIISYLPNIVATLFLAGFVAYAWQEPSQAPPDGNVAAPINVGPAAQTKQGDLNLDGMLKVGGDILDGLGNIIYNAATGKIERARLPFEQGDITSDVDANTYDAGYYNVSNLSPANVKKDLSFGRGQTGTAEVFKSGDIGAFGVLNWQFVTGWLPGSGAPCLISCPTQNPYVIWKSYASNPNFIIKNDPRSLMSYQMTSVTDCWSTYSYPNCVNAPLAQGYTAACASGWLKQYVQGSQYFATQYSPCANGSYCDWAYCLYP